MVTVAVMVVLVSISLSGATFLPEVPHFVLLPGGVQVPARLVHQSTLLPNGSLVLDDGTFVANGSYKPLSVPTVANSNWIGYADAKATCYYDPHRGYPVCEPKYKAITAHWNIPAIPSRSASSLLYIFDGMQPYASYSLPLLQPVLQWGWNGILGGQFWTIVSWYIYTDSNGQLRYLHSSGIADRTSTYDEVFGGIGWVSGTTYTITTTFENAACKAGYYACPSQTLTVNSGFYTAYSFISVVLEGYHYTGSGWVYLDTCNELPGNIHFTSLTIADDTGHIGPAYMEETFVNTVCGGFAVHILSGSSVDIIT